MKVAMHVGQLFQAVPGGIGRYVEGLLDALPEAGVNLATFASGAPRPDADYQLPHHVDLGMPGPPWRYELWHRWRRPPIPVEADVMHAPSLAVPPSREIPLIVTIHDLAFLRHPEVFTDRGVAFHRRGLAIAYREAEAILTVSEFTRGELVRAGFEPERLHVAPLGIVVEPGEPAAILDARVAAVGVERPFILSVGTIEPRKGLDILAAAFARVRRAHPDLTLVIAGPKGWLTVPGLDAPGIVRLGKVDEATLDALYRRATLCALPSRYEGFGLPALEAMARGCPVIASDATALPGVVGDAGVLVPPGDVVGWTATLSDLLGDDAARADYAARGLSRAATFTWAASARAHRDAYAAAGLYAARS
jgi:glycosyltransferase involved in cell wall biosynthesis